MGQFDHVQYHVVPNLPDHHLHLDFWLGSSNDCQTWALFAVDKNYEIANQEISPSDLVAWLTAPPKDNSDTIGAILAHVHFAILQGKLLDDSLIHSIIALHPFPSYLTVAHYLPEGPEEWLPLPAEIMVSFELSEGACLYPSIFEEYKRDSFKDVIATLFSPRIDGNTLSYSLLIRKVVPLESYEVDWPLARRGK